MNRIVRSIAALAVMGMPLVSCAPHLKKLSNATKGPYRYANPHGVTLPEQPVPSVDDYSPRTPVPVSPAQETTPAPTLPYAVPETGPGAAPVPAPASGPVAPAVPAAPKPPGKEGAMVLPHGGQQIGSL